MADFLSSRRAELESKDKAEVTALLGEPVVVRHWKTMAPPENATAAEVAAFEETLLDEIWIYQNGRVHFSLAGQVVKVDDKVTRDLPPPEPPLIA